MALVKWFYQSRIILFLLCVSCLFTFNSVFGQTNTWDGSNSANWFVNANWSLNHVPTAAEDVVIPNGITATITVNTAAVCKSFTMSGGATANIVSISGSNSLTVTNGISIGAGTGSGDNKTLAVNAGTLSCASITVAATTNSNRSSGISISTGTATVSGSITMGDVNDDVTFTGAGTLNIGSTGTMTGGTLTPSTGTVNYTGTAQTVGNYTYRNLTLSGSGIKTLQAGTTTINGNFTLSGSATTTAVVALSIGGNFDLESGTSFTAGAFTHSIGGNWVNNGGTFTNTGSTISLDGNTQSIGGNTNTTFNKLTLSGNTVTTASRVLTIGSDFTLGTNATFIAGAFTHAIAGNWINSGGTFTSTGSTINFNGAAQSIGGTATTYFYNVSLSGSNDKTFGLPTGFNNNLSITSPAKANLGTIKIHFAKTLTLGGSSKASGTWGNTASTAANTDNTYFSPTSGILYVGIPPTVTAVADGNWSTAAAWDCNCVPPAFANIVIPSGRTVNIPAFTTIDHTNPADITITVNGVINLNEFSYLSIDATDILIVNTGGQITSNAFFFAGIVSGGTTITIRDPGWWNGNNGIGPLNGPVTITNGALPITLLYFKGRQLDKQVILEWASATEENFDYYRIEKSLDGVKFEELSRVKGSSFSTEKKEYSLVDSYPVSGKIYYRLVSVDLDGTSEQFQIIMVDFVAGEKRVNVYPNPVVIGDNIVVQPNFRVTEGDALIIHNNLGQSVFKASLNTSTPISIGTSSWAAGLYFITIYSNDGKFTEKVIVR